jgi:succinate-acetate transporter protein
LGYDCVLVFGHCDGFYAIGVQIPEDRVAVQGVGKFLAVLFWLLLLAFVLLDGVVIGKVSAAAVAGWEIFIVGLLAWYIALATLANTVLQKEGSTAS